MYIVTAGLAVVEEIRLKMLIFVLTSQVYFQIHITKQHMSSRINTAWPIYVMLHCSFTR